MECEDKGVTKNYKINEIVHTQTKVILAGWMNDGRTKIVETSSEISKGRHRISFDRINVLSFSHEYIYLRIMTVNISN